MKKSILLIIFFLLTGISSVYSIEIGCSVSKANLGDFPIIQIISMKAEPGTFNPNDYQDEEDGEIGYLALSVEISGNGKTITLEGNFPYMQVEGMGLMKMGNGNVAINYITMEEFNEIFSLSPTVTCAAT